MIDDFVPAKQAANFGRERVRESLDLSAIFEQYEREERN